MKAEFFAVGNVFAQSALAAVHVDDGDAEAFLHQTDGEVHGDCGFARAALFIADDNNMGFFY